MTDITMSKYYDIDSDISRCKYIPENASVAYANAAIKESGLGFCCLYDERRKVKAVLYDRDVEPLLQQGRSDAGVLKLGEHNILLQMDSPLLNINADYLFHSFPHNFSPLVNSKNEVVALVRKKHLSTYSVKENPVVLMAGGLGIRLRPYTETVPKPLLKIGGISILERILVYFRYYGFRNFYISVNYLAEQIKDTFKDGSQFGVNIRYLHEKKWLGTAGSIALMPRPKLPCLVSNGDLIMDVELDKFLQRHQEVQASGTMCTYSYSYKIAYGVVQSQGEEYQSMIEKPTHYFQVNTGLYCISPEIWNYFPKGEKVDMPSLFDAMSKDGRKVCVYPHEGKWIDIGTLNDFERLSAGDDSHA